MTKEEFTKGYTFVKDETYVADGKGWLHSSNSCINKFAADNTYGVVTETPDGNTSTNAILNWTSNKTQRDQLIKDYKDRALNTLWQVQTCSRWNNLRYLRRYQDFHSRIADYCKLW